jgi:hypothetical protein
MTVYAYLRVSTDQQDVDNQRYGLLAYANAHSLGPLQFVEDIISGRLTWRDCQRLRRNVPKQAIWRCRVFLASNLLGFSYMGIATH